MPDLTTFLPSLTQAGATGVFLWWMMVRVERILNDLRKSNDALALSITLEVLSRPNLPPHTRRQAEESVTAIKLRQQQAGT